MASRLYVPPVRQIWVPSKPVIWTPETLIHIPEAPDILVSIGGVISVKERSYARVIGHPDLADGCRHRVGDTLYVGFREAFQRIRSGEEVELHWTPDAEDERALAPIRKLVMKARSNDPRSRYDGW